MVVRGVDERANAGCRVLKARDSRRSSSSSPSAGGIIKKNKRRIFGINIEAGTSPLPIHLLNIGGAVLEKSRFARGHQ